VVASAITLAKPFGLADDHGLRDRGESWNTPLDGDPPLRALLLGQADRGDLWMRVRGPRLVVVVDRLGSSPAISVDRNDSLVRGDMGEPSARLSGAPMA